MNNGPQSLFLTVDICCWGVRAPGLIHASFTVLPNIASCAQRGSGKYGPQGGDGPRMRWCGLIGNRSGVFVQASPITLKGVRHRSPIATQGSHIGRSSRPGVRSGNRSVTAHALSLKPFPDLGSLCPLLSIQQSGLVTRNHQGAQAPALRYSWRFFVPGCFVLWRLCVGRLRARRFP